MSYSFYFYSYKQIYYGYREFSGDFYSENLTGPQFELGEDLGFEFEFGGHSASGEIQLTTYESEYRQDYGPNNYQINRSRSYNGWGRGEPTIEEVGAESADVEGEEDVEEY